MHIGIDLGTSGVRALLVDEAGTPVALAESHTTVAHPQHGWAEQDPSEWRAALEIALGKTARGLPTF